MAISGGFISLFPQFLTNSQGRYDCYEKNRVQWARAYLPGTFSLSIFSLSSLAKTIARWQACSNLKSCHAKSILLKDKLPIRRFNLIMARMFRVGFKCFMARLPFLPRFRPSLSKKEKKIKK